MKPTLQWLNDEVAYMAAPVNTGLLVKNKKAMIIDTGLDKDHAQKVIKLLDAEGIVPIAIFNTHSHADHCGGNAQLQKQLNLPVIAPAWERPFIENPYLESLALYGGAHPPAALQNKFLKSKPSQVRHTFLPDQGSLTYDEFTLHLIPLPGHSMQQTGVFYAGILFSADVLLGSTYLEKHLIPFNADIISHRRSLKMMGEIAFELCLPAHGEPLNNVTGLIKQNEDALDYIDTWLQEHTLVASTLDELLSAFCTAHEVGMDTISQYHLYRTALAAHLTSLSEENNMKHFVHQNKFLWKRIDETKTKSL